MDMTQLSLDQLANETIHLSQKLRDNTEFKIEDLHDFSEEVEKHCEKHCEEEIREEALEESELSSDLEVHELPNKPGIIFHLSLAGGTFILRALATDSIENVWPKIMDEPKSKEFKSLKLSGDFDFSKLQYYPVERFEQAEVLKEHFSNRRIPIDEDVLCNIGDPGFSWWLDLKPASVSVYFKSHGVECSKNYLRLGPLSDLSIFQSRFKRVVERLNQIDSLGISCDEKCLSLKCSKPHLPIFQELKNLFLSGAWSSSGDLYSSLEKNTTLRLFLEEIALVRRFWLEVEKEINFSTEKLSTATKVQ
ncbi:MAG: hypothetical protein ACPGJV_03290 [Bacteriovoracaceae bacterium]